VLQRVLEIPQAFDLYQRLVGGRDSKRRFVEEHVEPHATDRVLDIGCGTGALRSLMPNGVSYLGVEIDPGYVDAARSRFGNEGEFVCSDIRTLELPAERTFDLAIAYGVFHHLDDDTASRAVDVAATALAGAGRLVISEPCWVPGSQRSFERLLMRLDRGSFVRTIDEYVALVGTRFDQIATHVVPDTYRVPYTMVVVDATL
jgi:SAM-dependent methyltransferase